MILNLGRFNEHWTPGLPPFKHLMWNLTVMICKSSKQKVKIREMRIPKVLMFHRVVVACH